MKQEIYITNNLANALYRNRNYDVYTSYRLFRATEEGKMYFYLNDQCNLNLEDQNWLLLGYNENNQLKLNGDITREICIRYIKQRQNYVNMHTICEIANINYSTYRGWNNRGLSFSNKKLEQLVDVIMKIF